MTKKKRSVLLSVMTLALCLALIASGMYALFSDEVRLTNHLQAGKLDITLTRKSLTTKSIDPATGSLADTEQIKDVDFSNPTNKNVFDITDDTLIVPGSFYSAVMQISNNSDVAFGYWIEIVFDGTVDLTLAKQLKITVSTSDGEKSISTTLDKSKGLIGEETDPIEILATSGSALFTISVEFTDLGLDNDLAQNKSFEFDVIVHAVQIASEPTQSN